MWTQLKRSWLRYRVEDGPMQDFLAAPLPDRRADVRTLDILSLDLETTGLDPGTHQIVSVGHVLIRSGRIAMQTACHAFVQIDGSVEQSATIHGIMDHHLQEAEPHDEVLQDLLTHMRGRVLLFHHAPMDMGFLNAAYKQLYGVPLNAYVVDTLALARQNRPPHEVPRDGELRLDALRSQYGLPRYAAHDALTDALATAELFLAMVAHRAGADALPLKDLL